MTGQCSCSRTAPAIATRPIHRAVLVRWLTVAVVVLSAPACQQLTNPAAQAELQQSLYELQDLLVQMRDETAMLQSQVDSLQGVVARQDTSLRRVANQLGMPLP